MTSPNPEDVPYIDDDAPPMEYHDAIKTMRSMLRMAFWEDFRFVQEDPHTFLVFKGDDPLPVNRVKLARAVLPPANLLGVHRG